MLQNRKRTIKTLLMDQSFVAGLGNIYTDEALHLARIHPLQRSDMLNLEQVERLLGSIREVLMEGIGARS
jgi:formamidopyrimidine-DNA glycosylase